MSITHTAHPWKALCCSTLTLFALFAPCSQSGRHAGALSQPCQRMGNENLPSKNCKNMHALISVPPRFIFISVPLLVVNSCQSHFGIVRTQSQHTLSARGVAHDIPTCFEQITSSVFMKFSPVFWAQPRKTNCRWVKSGWGICVWVCPNYQRGLRAGAWMRVGVCEFVYNFLRGRAGVNFRPPFLVGVYAGRCRVQSVPESCGWRAAIYPPAIHLKCVGFGCFTAERVRAFHRF